MSVGNVRDIGEILASIETLKEQADHLHEMHEHQDNAPEKDSLPAPPVAEIAARKADVVLLHDVYQKGISQQERKAESQILLLIKKRKLGCRQGLNPLLQKLSLIRCYPLS